MNLKQLLWLLAVCGVAVLGVVVIRLADPSTAPAASGKRLVLPDFPLNDIEAVTLADASGSCEIRKKNGRWCVPSRHDYPADFNAVSRLLTDLADMTVIQSVQAGESQYGRLNLLPPAKDGANSGIEVVCRLAGGKTAGHVILGKNYEIPRSPEDAPADNAAPCRFLLLPEKKSVAVVKANIGSAATLAASWLDPEFLNLLEIRSVTLKAGDQILWTLARETAGGALRLTDLKAGETANQDQIARAGATRDWGCFTDVAGRCADQPAARAEFRQELQVVEFTGGEFVLRFGDWTADRQQRRVMVDATFTPQPRNSAEHETAADQKAADENHARAQAETRKRVEELKARTAGWIYLLSASALEGLPGERQAFLKSAAPPPASPAK